MNKFKAAELKKSRSIKNAQIPTAYKAHVMLFDLFVITSEITPLKTVRRQIQDL